MAMGLLQPEEPLNPILVSLCTSKHQEKITKGKNHSNRVLLFRLNLEKEGTIKKEKHKVILLNSYYTICGYKWHD